MTTPHPERPSGVDVAAVRALIYPCICGHEKGDHQMRIGQRGNYTPCCITGCECGGFRKAGRAKIAALRQLMQWAALQRENIALLAALDQQQRENERLEREKADVWAHHAHAVDENTRLTADLAAAQAECQRLRVLIMLPEDREVALLKEVAAAQAALAQAEHQRDVAIANGDALKADRDFAMSRTVQAEQERDEARDTLVRVSMERNALISGGRS